MLTVVITVLGVLALQPGNEPAGSTRADPATGIHFPATEIAGQFLAALTSGDTAAAAALTDDPAAATAQLDAVWRSLRPVALDAGRDELVEPPAGATTVVERYTLTWDLGQERVWEYRGAMRLAKKGDDWLVRWQPALLHPRLTAGHTLALRDLTGRPAVQDRDGAPLLTWTDQGPAATNRKVAPVLTPGMARIARGQVTADGWYVALATTAGKEVALLHGNRPTALTATVSRQVQQAAQAAVNAQPAAAMLVAIQPSTGDLLAVAQNPAAGNGPLALNGLYPPGSTFKIATAAAIVEAGIADVGTTVPCPGQATIGERTVRNANFALGDVPLRTAFAQSCNTTFAMQAAKLPPDALRQAAGRLGLTADFDIPGLVTELGDVPETALPAEQVENSIGQGTVQASCLGLALMAATVAGGRATTPRLWRDLPTTVNSGYQPPSAAVLGSLRTMMRAVVTSGRGSALAGYGNVSGKTGTAQVGDGSAAHGWFAGYRDDLAFATLVLDGASSATAVTVTGRFLGALR